MASIGNILDLNGIYKEQFSYSLPKKTLESFLSGVAFDNLTPYNQEENRQLVQDINRLNERIILSQPQKTRKAYITAGAPGAGKTILLQRDLGEKMFSGEHCAYIDPDDVCLKNYMTDYKKDAEKGFGSKESRQRAYNKWRPASNGLTHIILANLIKEGYAFYYGTTSSSPGVPIFFDFLKKQGYQIRLLHVTAPDDIRWGSILERDKTFVQTTEKDTYEKGLLVPQRIIDYLSYADTIEFYYRNKINQEAHMAATWVKNGLNLDTLGTLDIQDAARYEEIKRIHNTAIETLNRPELRWEDIVEKRSITLAKTT